MSPFHGKRLWWSAVAVVLILITAVTGVATTHTGSAPVFALIQQLAPGNVQFGTLHGRLIGPIHATGISVPLPEGSLTIDRLSLDWSPLRLLRGELAIARLRVGHIVLTETAASPPPPSRPPELPAIHFPVRITLAESSMESFTLVRGEGERPAFRIHDFSAQIRAESRRIVLPELRIGTDYGDVFLSGYLEPHGDYPLAVQAAVRIRAAGMPELTASVAVSGDLNHLRLRTATAAPLISRLDMQFDKPLTGLRYRGELTVSGFDSRYWPQITLPMTADAQATLHGTAEQIAATIRLNGQLQQIPLSGRFDITANRHSARIHRSRIQAGETGTTLTAQGTVDYAGKTPRLDMDASWRGLQWPPTGPPRVLSNDGQLRITGALDDYTLQAHGSVWSPLAPTARFHTVAHGRTDRLTLRSFEYDLDDAGTLSLHGELAWNDGLHLDAAANWHDLQWPVGNGQILTSRSGDLALRGSLDQYRFQINSHLLMAPLPAGVWQVQGNGDTRSLNIDTLRLDALDGHLNARGQIAWQPTVSWHARFDARSLHLDALLPEAPATVSLSGTSRGTVARDGYTAQLALERLRAEIGKAELTGFATLGFSPETVRLSPLVLHSGSNYLVAAGSVGADAALSWHVDPLDLAAWPLPVAVSGIVQGAGSLRGPLTLPHLGMHIQAQNLSWEDRRIGHLSLTAQVDPSDTTASLISAAAVDLEQAGRKIDWIAARLDGRLARHQILAALSAGDAFASLEAATSWQNRRFAGQILDTRLDIPATGPWRQQHPAQLVWAPQRLMLSNYCLVGQQRRICAKFDRTADDLSAAVRGNGIDLAWLNRFLPPNLRTAGDIDFGITATTRGQPYLHLTGLVSADSGTLTLQRDDGNTVAFPITGFSLRLNADPQQLQLDGELDIERQGRIAARINAPPLAIARPADAFHALEGRVQISLAELSMIPAWVPQISRVSGHGSATIDFSTAPGRETLNLQMAMEAENMVIPDAGLTVDKATLSARGDADNLVYGVKLETAGQWLRLKGDLRRQAGSWTNHLTLSGEDFRVLNTPDYRIAISPDIVIEMTPPNVHIYGTVAVPYARITPQKFTPGAVTPSHDVVIVDDDAPTTGDDRWNIDAVIRLDLGKDVKVDAFGLTANLAGTIAILESPGQLTSGSGELHITSGQYKAYGQDLTIERGRLVFAGGPIDDPGLDFRAYRQVDAVRAGISVTGTLSAPQLRLYSNPPMAQSEVLSYLLLGRGLNNASDQESQSVLSAAAALTAGGTYLANQISRRLGIEDLTIEAGNTTGGETTVFIGKYLSPRLYISIGTNVVRQATTFQVRYQLSSKWRLEGESGANSSVDLLYTLESGD